MYDADSRLRSDRGFAVWQAFPEPIVVRLARCDTAFNHDWKERLAKAAAAGMPAPETQSRPAQGHGASRL